MKYFFPLLMSVLVLLGVVITATPWVAEYWFPSQATGFRRANETEIKQALAGWLNVKPSDLALAQGIQHVSPERKMAWFKFEVERSAVERFIRSVRLSQKELTSMVMQERFQRVMPPVDWWQPSSLGRQSFFTGQIAGQQLNLIYNADRQQGFLLVISQPSPQAVSR